jgi:hypothetical protein
VGTVHPEDATAELDALRARLYRPGATAEDLRRYETARDATSPEPESVASAAERVPASHPGRRRLLGAALAVAVLTGGVVARQLSAVPSPSATPHAAASPVDDLLHWHPEHPVTGTHLPHSPAVQQFHGRGAGAAQLEARGLPETEGRLEILLTVADDAPVLWTATRVDRGPGSIVNVRVLAEHDGMQRRAVPVPVSFLFAGGPPTEVHVQVPNGVAWGLVVAPESRAHAALTPPSAAPPTVRAARSKETTWSTGSWAAPA